MLAESIIYHSWCPPLFHKNQRTSFQYPLFFRNADSTFLFQLKTLRCFLLKVSQHPIPSPAEILSTSVSLKNGDLISSIIETPVKTYKSLPSSALDPPPSLCNLDPENHQSAYRLFENYMLNDCSFGYYAQAQLYHYGINIPRDLNQAYTIYKQGSEAKELGCMHKITRIAVEGDLAEKFDKPLNLNQAVFPFYQDFL